MKQLLRADILRIAALAECDQRTVQRYLSGLAVRNLVRGRIERAMKDLKLR